MGKIIEFRRPDTSKAKPATDLAARVDTIATASPADREYLTAHQFCHAIDETLVWRLWTLTEWQGGRSPYAATRTTLRSTIKKFAASVSLDGRMLPGFDGLDLMGIDTSILRTRYSKLRQDQRSLAKRAAVPYVAHRTKLEKDAYDADLLNDAEQQLLVAARIALDALEAGSLPAHFNGNDRWVNLLVARAQQF